jgi:hypothetical protein
MCGLLLTRLIASDNGRVGGEREDDEETLHPSDEEDSNDIVPASDDRYVPTLITDNYGESECVFVRCVTGY